MVHVKVLIWALGALALASGVLACAPVESTPPAPTLEEHLGLPVLDRHTNLPALDCSSDYDERGFTSLVELSPSAAAANTTPVPVAFSLFSHWPRQLDEVVDVADLEAWVQNVLEHTDTVFAACGLALEIQRAELVAAAPASLDVDANQPGSKLAEVPEDADPETFLYEQNESLTDDVRALLAFARRDLPDGTLAVVVVDRIVAHGHSQQVAVGALSFPPVVYHQPEDFPTRNGVLVGAGYPGCGVLPSRPSPRTVAHELGHMLLNLAHHEADSDNLMSRVLGPTLTEAQCALARKNLAALYGADPIVDPGPPD